MPVLLSSPEPTAPVTPPTRPGPLPDITPWIREDHFPGMDGVTWTGWDGLTWDLLCRNPHDPTSGVALGRGMRGLHTPEVAAYTSDSPAIDGAAYLGYQVQPREVFMVVRVYNAAGSQDWVEHDRRFWRGMLPAYPGLRSPGRLTVTHPNGDQRWLELYPQPKGDHEFQVDPTRRGWQSYGCYFTAFRPFWLGPKMPARTFSGVGSAGFFGGAVGGQGAPFVIGDQGVFGAATISNPGDEPAWPVYTLHGPFSQVKIGTMDSSATIAIDVPAGASIVVDTDPMAQTIADADGNLVMPKSLSGAPFTPVMPGVNVPLVAEMTGSGSVGVELQPLYHRAW